MPYLSVYGIDVFYRDEGEGLPVIFGHSSTGSSGQWRDLIGNLAATHRCLAPDHLGYGRTGAYNGSQPMMDHEMAVIDALLGLFEGPAHFVGHSFGGSVLARVAVRVPHRVKSLTLIEPILFYLLEARRMDDDLTVLRAVSERVCGYVEAGDSEQAARAFIEYWAGPGAFDSMPGGLRETVTRGMAKVRDEWPWVFEPCGATAVRLAELKCPVQLIAGSKTTAAAAAVIGILRETWPAARYHEIDGAGHMSPVSHAGLVNPIIEKFVA